MKNIKSCTSSIRIIVSGLMFMVTVGAWSQTSGEYQYDYVFFDNYRIGGRYFFSDVQYSNGSWVKNEQGKLPTSTLVSFTPPQSIELCYTNNELGNWAATLFYPAWRGKDFFKPAYYLNMLIFITSETSPDELPMITLLKSDSSASQSLSMKDYLSEAQIFGKDRWLYVRIPIINFGAFDLTRHTDIKGIRFSQASHLTKTHTLFIDQIEFFPRNMEGLTKNIAPELVEAKGYDQHVDIVWHRHLDEKIKYIKIYRSLDGKTFKPIGIQEPYLTRFTDFTGKSHQQYYYKVTFLDYHYNESTFSNTLSATTRPFSDDELLTMIQEASFRYYWEGAEPTSGMALENIHGRHHMIATGASGFGMMAILVGVERKFITRQQAVDRFLTITQFLEKAEKFHGAFSHFLDGRTGKVVTFFGQYDDGGDLVETSFLMQGLLAARQYFTLNTPDEKLIRNRITKLWEGVEWAWYTREKNGSFLYWHWSPKHQWHLNHKLIGWNETMITYLLAIASPKHSVKPELYYRGFASQSEEAQLYREAWGRTDEGARYANGNTYYGIELPVAASNGGPIFFTHYSYFGLNPKMITDRYTNYFENNRRIAMINYRYCVENPKRFIGYGPGCWGLTGSDGPTGYAAHEPSYHGDHGTMTSTGAISSFPYTPEESMQALKNYYYQYGSFLWGEYGFRDAFNLTKNWSATIYMGLNQAPMTIMIENHRSGFMWDLFMKDPDIKKMTQKVFGEK